MKCKALKAFPFSPDGITSRQAEDGEIVEIPDALVRGLVREKFVELASVETIIDTGEPDESENTEPEEDDPLDALRDKLEGLTGEKPDGRWGEERLLDKIAEAEHAVRLEAAAAEGA